jgi:hypothetical protein
VTSRAKVAATEVAEAPRSTRPGGRPAVLERAATGAAANDRRQGAGCEFRRPGASQPVGTTIIGSDPDASELGRHPVLVGVDEIRTLTTPGGRELVRFDNRRATICRIVDLGAVTLEPALVSTLLGALVVAPCDFRVSGPVLTEILSARFRVDHAAAPRAGSGPRRARTTFRHDGGARAGGIHGRARGRPGRSARRSRRRPRGRAARQARRRSAAADPGARAAADGSPGG